MALSREDLKAKILEKALTGPKAQLYVKDFYACDPESGPRDIKNAANDLVKEGKMTFWSSGSTTMYAAQGRAKDEENRQFFCFLEAGRKQLVLFCFAFAAPYPVLAGLDVQAVFA